MKFGQSKAKRLQALHKVAEYIVDCENNEYDSYVSYCEENDLNPSNIKGKEQSNHVYALALQGLDLDFPVDPDTCEHDDLDKHNSCLICGTNIAETKLSQSIDRATERG